MCFFQEELHELQMSPGGARRMPRRVGVGAGAPRPQGRRVKGAVQLRSQGCGARMGATWTPPSQGQ